MHKINYNKILKEKKRADEYGFHEESYINNIKETKYGETVLISFPENLDEDSISIFLTSFIKGKYHRAYMYLIFNNKTMDIPDIGILKEEAKSRGYGDLLMQTAIEIAKSKGIQLITGLMISDSNEHRERQIKYYTKYGFHIDESNKIKLIL